MLSHPSHLPLVFRFPPSPIAQFVFFPAPTPFVMAGLRACCGRTKRM
jgi:hypothetical protein